MASGLLVDYLGVGLAADRPVAPDIYTGALALYFATDTGILSGWDGAAWETLSSTGGIVAVAPTGGYQDGALLVYDGVAEAWVELPQGAPGDVLTASLSGPPDWVPAAGGGDVSGPGSSVDNTVPRFVGTAGDEIEDTGIVIGDNDELYGYKAQVERQTGTSYTLTESDTGQIMEFSDAGTITITLPSTMPKGFACTVVQAGAGVLDFVAESGGTLSNRQGHNSSAGQYAVCLLYVSENTSGAAWVLGGDTAS